jgi:hypothetical protein
LQLHNALWWFVFLSALFILKHFVADFLLQTGWMAFGKERDKQWTAPLAVHAGIHGVATLLICLAIAPQLAWLGAVDFAVHSIFDRVKALVTRAAGATPEQTTFWWFLGFDQTLHHLTDLAFVFVLATATLS